MSHKYFLIAAFFFAFSAQASEVILPPALPGDDASPEGLNNLAPAANGNENKDIFQGTVLPKPIHIASADTGGNVFEFPTLPAPAEAQNTLNGKAFWKEEIRKALVAKGAGEDIVVDSIRFGHSITQAEQQAQKWHAQDVAFQPKYNRFSGILVSAGQNAISFRGDYGAMKTVPVLHTRLRKGDIIRASDIEMRPILTACLRHGVTVADENQLIGKTLKRPIAIGQPVRVSDLLLPVAVKANNEVEMLYSGNGINVTDRGVAVEDGAIGEIIRIRNTKSGAVVRARVESANRVSVNYFDSPSPIAATAGEPHALN